MLRTRVITGCMLGALLLLGLFLLPPRHGPCWHSAPYSPSAPGSGADSAPCAARRATRLYAAASRSLLRSSWRWSADPAHLMLLLRRPACGGWSRLLWLIAGAEPSIGRVLALLCGAAGVGAGVRRAGAAADCRAGFRARSADRAVAGADGLRRGYRRVFRRAQFRAAQTGAARQSGKDLGGRRRRRWLMVALVAWGGAVYFDLPPLGAWHSAAPWAFFPSSAI